MALGQCADDYFSKLNPIASRIYADLNETKAQYEQLWDTLDSKEQEQILSETIITPEICIKYKQTSPCKKTGQDYAQKIVIDDNYKYRDEHSGPFSFKTRSQHDLRLFQNTQEQIHKKPVLKPRPKVQKIVDVIMEKKEMAMDEDEGGNLPLTGLDFLDNW